MTALRVLIVEDEPDIRDLLVFHLERDGYQVVKARNGRTRCARPRFHHPTWSCST